MAISNQSRPGFASRNHLALVLLAICSLTISVATRYTTGSTELQNATNVKAKSEASAGHRQRLLISGLQSTSPTAGFTLFQPPRSSVLAVSVVVPSTNLSSESWLYNRPPP